MLLCDRTGIPRKGLQPDGPQLFAALSVLAADSITISHELLGAVVSSHSRQTCVIAPVQTPSLEHHATPLRQNSN